MATTVYDIARAAGVGRTTVLRALWDRDDINPETKARIRKIAAELKYRPNHIARSLVTGQSSLVGLVASPTTYLSSFDAIETIEAELRNAGYTMILSNSGGYPGGERRSLEQFLANRVAGVVAAPASSGAELQAYEEMLEAGAKIVIVDRLVENLPVPQLIGDDYRAARLAAEHLISLGHTRIAYLAIPQVSHAGRERVRGFRDAVREAGLGEDPASIIETPFGERCGEEATRELLNRRDRPTAIIARHDVVAAGAIRAIYSAGLRVPDDISIVGNGDLWCSDVLRQPLTTVRHPIHEMAQIAVAKLLAMLSGEQIEPTVEVLDVDFVLRSSTAPPKAI